MEARKCPQRNNQSVNPKPCCLLTSTASRGSLTPSRRSGTAPRRWQSNRGPTLHSLRHTHASHLIAVGMDILTISRRLGRVGRREGRTSGLRRGGKGITARGVPYGAGCDWNAAQVAKCCAARPEWQRRHNGGLPPGVTYVNEKGLEVVAQAKLQSGDYAPLIAADFERPRELATTRNVKMRLRQFGGTTDMPALNRGLFFKEVQPDRFRVGERCVEGVGSHCPAVPIS
jgi:hypothetical protein